MPALPTVNNRYDFRQVPPGAGQSTDSIHIQYAVDYLNGRHLKNSFDRGFNIMLIVFLVRHPLAKLQLSSNSLCKRLWHTSASRFKMPLGFTVRFRFLSKKLKGASCCVLISWLAGSVGLPHYYLESVRCLSEAKRLIWSVGKRGPSWRVENREFCHLSRVCLNQRWCGSHSSGLLTFGKRAP